MGRNTFNSIPAKILKNCICIVFSKNVPPQLYSHNIFFIKSLDEFGG
nr:hypothetical protein [Rickettsia akari]